MADIPRPGDVGTVIRWPRPGIHASRTQFFASDRLTFVTPQVQTWKAIYPDPVRRVWRPHVGILFVPPVNQVVVPPQWTPRYPDRLNPPIWRRPGQFTPDLFPTTVVTFGWKGSYADQVTRLRIHPSVLPQSPIGFQSVQTVKLEWLPRYPDLHWRKGLPSQLHQTFGQNIDPIVNPPSPELSWRGWQPDQIARAETLRAHLQQAWASDRIRPVSPDLAWRVIAPDLIFRKTLSVAAMPSEFFQQRVIQPDLRMDWQMAASEPVRRIRRLEGLTMRPAEVPVSPVVWVFDRPDPPDAPLRRPFLITGGGTPPIAIVTIGTNLGWQGVQPALLLRPVGLIGGALASTIVQPELPTPGAWCVMFTDDAILTSELTPEIFKVPLLADQMVRTPMLINEEVC